MRNVRRLLLIAFGLAACLIGVGLLAASGLIASPQPPLPSYVASTQSAATFEETIQQAIQQAAPDGSFAARVTQEQFTSWLQIKAPQYAALQKQAWPFKNGQASFTAGKATVYAILEQAGAPETAVQMALLPIIDANGELVIKAESAQLGILGVPAPLLDKLNAVIHDAVSGQLDRFRGKYKLSQLSLANGTLSISGKVIKP